jgi:ComF family protein
MNRHILRNTHALQPRKLATVDPRSIPSLLASILAPPLCAACDRPCALRDPVCDRCADALARVRPGVALVPGLEQVAYAARYDGVARELVAALKFGRRLQVASVLADALARAVAPLAAGSVVVPVPAAPTRRRRRGFDPAELIAVALAARLGLELAHPLRRDNGPRQVGRRRADRLASPPRIEVSGVAPASALVVDDVLTTGATLAACADALRGAGCLRIRGAAFARALGPGTAAA